MDVTHLMFLDCQKYFRIPLASFQQVPIFPFFSSIEYISTLMVYVQGILHRVIQNYYAPSKRKIRESLVLSDGDFIGYNWFKEYLQNILNEVFKILHLLLMGYQTGSTNIYLFSFMSLIHSRKWEIRIASLSFLFRKDSH